MNGLLSALQLSDSALPIGRFVHSQGVESWLQAHPDAGAEEIAGLARTVVTAAARVDGAFLAHAHAAGDVDALRELDDRLTGRKTIPAARSVSVACGRQLAALAPGLTEDGLVVAFCARVDAGDSDGNLAVVTGVLGRGLGLDPLTAVAVELRGTAASVLSVAVRLNRLSPSRAQVQLAALHPAIADGCRTATATTLDDAFASIPELEIAALAHRRRPIRFFRT